MLFALVPSDGQPSSAAGDLQQVRTGRCCRPDALDGPGLVLARPPLIAERLARGDLVEVLPGHRNESPMGYWLLISPQSKTCEEVMMFSQLLMQQAADTEMSLNVKTPVKKNG